MATMNGAAMAVFSVRLSEASTNVINVPWQTEDGTGHAGTDYEAASGTLTFPAGSLEQTLQVEVYGRSPQDSTEDRTFLIRLDPPVDAMLENATAECVIQVVAQDGNVFTQVYIPAGPRGRPGNTGDTGLNTFELAKLNGFAGTLTQWLATVTGRNVELINDGTWINWRPVYFENPQPWVHLIELATISGTDGNPGDPGNDGREVQMQKSATAIQWRYTGEATWHDLVQLDDLKADPQPLVNRGNWSTGTTYNPGDYVAATSSSSTVKSLYFLLDAVPYVSSTEPKSDPTHWVELQPPQGPKGDDGREVTFRTNATHIQWQYEGDAAWTDLIALSALKGNPGDNGKSVELQKTATYLQWRLVGDTTWTNLVALTDITGAPGANGKNIELQKGATYIQWRVVGTTTWTNLVALADITGAPGTNGTNGATWLTGTAVPAAGTGANGDWYLRTPVGEIYQKASGAWTLQMTIASGNVVWYTGTAVPSNGTGKDGDLHLHEATGQIRKRVSGVWTNLILIPLLATSSQAKSADLSTIAATPAGVREFMEQYGWTANYMNDSTDLNTVTGISDRTVTFSFNASTANTPVASSYGRGIMIAGGGNYSTQIAWINDTAAMYFRFHNGTTWTAWAPFLLAASNKWTGVQYFDASQTHIGAAWSGSAGIEFGRTDGVSSTPYMDFHAGSTAVDHDCRILVSNGTGTVGAGVFSIFGSAVRPGTNNVTSLGDASVKWNTVYATNATINTSDARLKTGLREMTPPEIVAFSTIARLPNLWKWIEKQEAEGEGARLHSGPTVQAAIAVMGDNGLNWEDYACFCYDSWEATEESVTEVEGEVKVLVPARPAGDMYSFRREELLMLITRALAYKQDDLEARLAAIEARLGVQ